MSDDFNIESSDLPGVDGDAAHLSGGVSVINGNDYDASHPFPFMDHLKHWTGNHIDRVKLAAVQVAICFEAFNNVNKSGTFSEAVQHEMALKNYDAIVKDLFSQTGFISSQHRSFFNKMKGAQSQGTTITGKQIKDKYENVGRAIRNEIMPLEMINFYYNTVTTLNLHGTTCLNAVHRRRAGSDGAFRARSPGAGSVRRCGRDHLQRRWPALLHHASVRPHPRAGGAHRSPSATVTKKRHPEPAMFREPLATPTHLRQLATLLWTRHLELAAALACTGLAAATFLLLPIWVSRLFDSVFASGDWTRLAVHVAVGLSIFTLASAFNFTHTYLMMR